MVPPLAFTTAFALSLMDATAARTVSVFKDRAAARSKGPNFFTEVGVLNFVEHSFDFCLSGYWINVNLSSLFELANR